MTVTIALNVLQLYFKNKKVSHNIDIREIFVLVCCLGESWREGGGLPTQAVKQHTCRVFLWRIYSRCFSQNRSPRPSTLADYFGDRYRPAVIISFNCYWSSRESAYFPCKNTSVSAVSGLLPCSHEITSRCGDTTWHINGFCSSYEGGARGRATKRGRMTSSNVTPLTSLPSWVCILTVCFTVLMVSPSQRRISYYISWIEAYRHRRDVLFLIQQFWIWIVYMVFVSHCPYSV